MRIDMKELRKFVKSVWPGAQCAGDQFPKTFSTHPSWVTWGRLRVKVLSSSEAAGRQPRSRHPHRILVWDAECQKWQYAGKYAQHCAHKTGYWLKRPLKG